MTALIDAEPFAVPVNWDRAAFVIIDMQRDFLEPGGFGETLGNDVSLLQKTIKPIKALLERARAKGVLVIHTREGHRPDLSDAPRAKLERGAPSLRIGARGPMGRILVRGEPGHDIVPELYPKEGEPVIDKPGKGAFFATDLQPLLTYKNIETLVVCGVTTEVCVHTTVREANDRGYRCVVPSDCCGSYFPEFHAAGLAMIKAQGGIRLGVGFDASSRGALNGVAQRDDSKGEGFMTSTTFKPKLWVPGDWNAFFGFGTNILVNLLTLSALLRFVLQMPDALVFGRILPAAGLMMCMSTFYYAWLAYRLAKRTGRTDVCALPSGISVPHMFIVTLVIMLPVKLATGDPIKGWQAGLTWVFIQSFVLMAGGFLAPIIRKITPKAALLGALAGVSISFISMKPALEMFMTPMVGVVCFAIILVSWFGGVKYGGVPAGLVAIAAGTLIAWGSNLLGLHFGDMSAASLKASFQTFGFAVPHPVVGLVLGGLHWSFLKVILVTAIPFGIYDLVEAMDNVVSASAAGDEYPTTRVLTADGVVSLIGCLMGNPYINAVYIGHPGWKSMGGRIGYSAATGVMVIVLSWFGVISLMTALVPVVAISPILLYIGMLIGSQAFQESPRKHAPAIVVSLFPSLAAWGKLQIDNSLGAVSGIHHVTPEMVAKLQQVGIFYRGLTILGGGSILAGVVLGAITTYIVDRDFAKAAGFSAAGGVLTFLGLMHGEEVGAFQNPTVVIAYFAVAGVLFVCSRASVSAPAEVEQEETDAHAVAHEGEMATAK